MDLSPRLMGLRAILSRKLTDLRELPRRFRNLRVPDEYSFWVHFVMATCVGLTITLVGLFLAWRAQVIEGMVSDVKDHLRVQSAESKGILDRQDEGLRLLRQLKR